MRLVTRGDLDGLASTILITTMEQIDSIELIHPQDITDSKFEIKEGDIMANLPYNPNCSVWFDHHELTESNPTPPEIFKGRHQIAPSVARVIFEYYGSGKLKRFEHLVTETDRFDSAQLEPEDISDPQGIALIGFTIDPRTGMGRFKEYFLDLAKWFKTMELQEIMKQAEVKARVKKYRENNMLFTELLKHNSHLDENVAITDFRGLSSPAIGNRFAVYSMFPKCNVSLRLQWGPQRQFVAATLGHNIFNRTCRTNIGHLCSDFNGGGHRGAGACVLQPDRAEAQIKQIIQRLKGNN